MICIFPFEFGAGTILTKYRDMNCHWPRENSSFKNSAEARELRREVGIGVWLDMGATCTCSQFSYGVFEHWHAKTPWGKWFLILKRWGWGMIGGPLSSEGLVRWDRAFERVCKVTVTLLADSALAYHFLEHSNYVVDLCIPHKIILGRKFLTSLC